MQNEEINHTVLTYGARCNELKQVSQRMLKLLPERLIQLSREYRRSTSAGKADCRALADKRYEDFIDEYVNVKSAYQESWIILDTHRMLIDARKSMRAFHRP